MTRKYIFSSFNISCIVMKFKITLLCLFINSITFANQELYGKIQAHFKSQIPTDFFVFKVNQNAASVTNKNILYVHYSAIKKNQYCKNIFFVLDDAYSDSSNVLQYFEEVLNLKLSQKEKERIIIDHNLYSNLQSFEYLSHLYYFHKKQIIYNCSLKLEEPISYVLPYDIVEIKDLGNSKTLNLPFMNTLPDEFIKCNENNFILLSDNSGKVALIDRKTLKIKYTLNRESIDVIDLYTNYFAKNQKEVDFAKSHKNDLANANRSNINVYNIYTDGFDIYIFFCIQVVIEAKQNTTYLNEQGEKKIIKKNNPIAELFPFLMKTDTTFKVKELYKFEDLQGKLGKQIYTEPSNIMFVHNDTLFSSNLADKKVSEKYNKGVSIYLMQNKKTRLVGLSKSPMVENYQLKGNYYINGSFLKNKDSIYVLYNTSPYIYNIFKHSPVSRLTGDTTIVQTPDVYKRFMTDTVKTKINYFYLSAGKIKNNFFTVIYKNNDKRFFEVFDYQFRRLQLIDISAIVPHHGKCLINNDELLVFEFVKGKYIVHSYPIDFRE